MMDSGGIGATKKTSTNLNAHHIKQFRKTTYYNSLAYFSTVTIPSQAVECGVSSLESGVGNVECGV